MVGLSNLLIETRRLAHEAEDEALAHHTEESRRYVDALRSTDRSQVKKAITALSDLTCKTAKKVRRNQRRQYLQDALTYWYALARVKGVIGTVPTLPAYEPGFDNIREMPSDEDFDRCASTFCDAVKHISAFRGGRQFLEDDLQMGPYAAYADDLILILHWLAEKGQVKVDEIPLKSTLSHTRREMEPTMRVYSCTEESCTPENVGQTIRESLPIAAVHLCRA